MSRLGLLLLAAAALLCMSDVHGGGKGRHCGRPQIWIEISEPEKDIFIRGEETHFDIFLRSDREKFLRGYLHDCYLEATFPDAETSVELEKVSKVQYAFNTGPLTKLGTNTLSVSLYKHK